MSLRRRIIHKRKPLDGENEAERPNMSTNNEDVWRVSS
jgi:hypothetical protein